MTKISSQNISPNLLNLLITSMARVSVLRVFLIDPKRSYYQRQLEAATGLAIRAVQRELEKLSESGFLYRRLEGKRAYYSIDTQYPGYEELRRLFLVGAEPLDRLRAEFSVEVATQLLFKNKRSEDVLLVTYDGVSPSAVERCTEFCIEVISSDAFLAFLKNEPKRLHRFLKTGEDLLGRREDIIWRRIETAGFIVDKGKGIP